ncbi:MAG TPA: efflux RND transporter periplasmic adaptor subunit [Nannocystaceae bacterium]|nr:efflux RND transporter periplasmic adaptor subunit [Nannocystaceae bacterium]
MTRSETPTRLRIALAAVLLAACGGDGPSSIFAKDAKADQTETERATPVVTTTVKSGPIDARLTAASTIEAERMVTVHAESTGRILALAFEEGDQVREGAILGRIKSDLQASGLDRAATGLEKAKTDLANIEALFARNVASKQELDAARVTYKQALLDVGDRRRDVRNTKIIAPQHGTVTQRFVTEGAFVTSGAQIASIVDFDTLVARVYVPEKELDRIRVGQPADIVGKAAAGRRGAGEVVRIAPIVDSATGTVKVTVGLPKALAGGDHGFLPGMYAEVTLTTETRPKATLVPKQALVYDEDEAFVFVVDGDRVKRTRVELGLFDDDHTEVVKGVEVGAEIVESGHAGLKDGALVQRVDGTGQPVEPSASSASLVQNTAAEGA